MYLTFVGCKRNVIIAPDERWQTISIHFVCLVKSTESKDFQGKIIWQKCSSSSICIYLTYDRCNDFYDTGYVCFLQCSADVTNYRRLDTIRRTHYAIFQCNVNTVRPDRYMESTTPDRLSDFVLERRANATRRIITIQIRYDNIIIRRIIPLDTDLGVDLNILPESGRKSIVRDILLY